MSIEEKMADLTAALKENTAAIKAGGGGAAPAAARGRPVGSGKDKDKAAATSKHKADAVKAALLSVKDKLGSPAAKTIISDSGAEDLADLLTKKGLWDDVMEAVETALEDGSGDGEPDEDL